MRFGLIGKKLGHSFSKGYFTSKFEQLGLPHQYELFELPEIREFPKLWEQYPDLHGLNVTIPYKQEVIPYLKTLSPAAAQVGAVNTILKTADGLVGHNTDIIGFHQSLLKELGRFTPTHTLILGTGGAARAVLYVLREEMKVAHIQAVSRTPRSGFQGIPVATYEELDQVDLSYFQLVINTTPLGTYPDVEGHPSIPYARFDQLEKVWAIDLVYNPPFTAFLQKAREYGAHTQNGMDMLIGQAEAAWDIWNS
ncbi:MAG: shikimate dehydrogenase [Bacteroidota bacterium]